MATTDLIIIIAVSIGFILGFFKGFIKELAAVVAVIAGVYVARMFSPSLAQMLQANTDVTLSTAQAMAFLLLFLFVVIVLFVVAHSLHKVFEAIALGGLNKILGGVFGALKVLLIMSVMLNVYDAFQQRFHFNPLAKGSGSVVEYPSQIYAFTIGFAPKLWDETHQYLP